MLAAALGGLGSIFEAIPIHTVAKVDETLDLRLSVALIGSHRLTAALGGNGKETTENENP